MSCNLILDDDDIADLRELEEANLTDRATILRQDLVEDRGVKVPADPDNPWPEVDTNVPVKVSPYNANRRIGSQGEAIVSVGDYNVRFAAGYDIRNTDKIRVTTLDNRVFRMIGKRYASDEVARVMAAEEVT